MVFNKQGQKTSVKGFTYKSNTGAAFFQAGVKENANVWVKHYTSKAAFEAADSKFGATGQVGGAAVRTQAPNSASGNVGSGSSGNDFFTAHQIPDGTTTGNFTLNGSDVRGFTFDGQYLWNTDRVSGTIYKNTTSGTEKDKFSALGTGDAIGITFDGQYLWHTDRGSNSVYQLTTSGTKKNSFDFSPEPRGITWDGGYLWIMTGGGGAGVIYKTKTNMTTVSSFNTSAGGNTGDLAHDGVYLYGSNEGAAVTYRYDKQGNRKSVISIGNASHGVTWDGEYLFNGMKSGFAYRVTGSASLDLSYQVSGFSLSSVGQTFTRNPQETMTLGDTYSDNTGKLTGFIYKDGSKVANAYVYAVEKSSGGDNFKGAYVTNSSGKYSLPEQGGEYMFGGDTYLVGVDFYYQSSSTYYGEEKSIVFQP